MTLSLISVVYINSYSIQHKFLINNKKTFIQMQTNLIIWYCMILKMYWEIWQRIMVMQLLIDVLFGENESRKEVYYIHECSSKSSKRSCEDADQITIFLCCLVFLPIWYAYNHSFYSKKIKIFWSFQVNIEINTLG